MTITADLFQRPLLDTAGWYLWNRADRPVACTIASCEKALRPSYCIVLYVCKERFAITYFVYAITSHDCRNHAMRRDKSSVHVPYASLLRAVVFALQYKNMEDTYSIFHALHNILYDIHGRKRPAFCCGRICRTAISEISHWYRRCMPDWFAACDRFYFHILLAAYFLHLASERNTEILNAAFTAAVSFRAHLGKDASGICSGKARYPHKRFPYAIPLLKLLQGDIEMFS